MASIRTQIELMDSISAPLMHITDALYMTINSFEEMQSAANNSFDASSLEGAREQANQATIAIEQLSEALSEVASPSLNIPQPNVPNQAPVDVPVQWKSDNMDVFTNTGVERFQQEVQSANNMLNN
jgi:hypothetical protein